MAITKGKTATATSKGNGSTASAGTSGITCLVSEGTLIEGTFTAQQDVRLDGTIKGDVICHSRLVIGQGGKVEGNVKASEAVVMGRISGEVVIRGNLQLKATSFIEGNLSAQKIAVEEGARYNGNCKIGTPS